jgi:quercetin dioxygenase-like cupin family protein
VLREALAETLAESLGPEAPPPALKGRLLAAATTGPMRHAPFFDELARLFDLGVDAVVRILESAGSESRWEPGPHPAIRLFHLEPGPALAGADAGFVRMPASFEWPSHRHTGTERVLILEGAYRETGGRIYRAGDIHEMGPNTEHGFTVLPDSPLLLALVLYGEIQML